MRHVDANNYTQYLDYLGKHPEEFKQLMDALTINVTNFFRYPEVFGLIERNILPDLLKKAQEKDRAVKIWSAGRSSGAEPYTLAMIVLDVMQNVDMNKTLLLPYLHQTLMIKVLKQP